jgi:hypothetical protein
MLTQSGKDEKEAMSQKEEVEETTKNCEDSAKKISI